MGDGIAGSVHAPVNQINARHSSTLTDPTARLQFENALEQQCPEGLGRRSPYDPPCTYLRNPSLLRPSEPPVNLKPNGDNLGGSNGRPDGSMVIDTTPIPQQPSNSPKVPEGPKHIGGIEDGTNTDDGRIKQDDGTNTHIFGWEWKI